ncbi:DUF2642 domain-containing protein [Paenibacillus sp. SYP-B3998]|uniref:DUF2642 domain-containing protein n=1 Tax=Paenibacillus sp. SYP-B3998 TaxID=2678564 RepID=A0A6G3ZV10_9BACL|nr:DUF2642 domain-containing protein [Paenibacillus sp. SYP-B3998]NEW05429.1 DUF2642 domain-containing protein [Paenibacillus sp. SYP-B3998]
MENLRMFIGKQVELMISGIKLPLKGVLIEVGSDLLIIHNGLHFFYIPSNHLHYLKLDTSPAALSVTQTEPPVELQTASISYRKMLMNAKGMFVEIYITGNQTVHGYLTHIMNDYFAFHSPVFHTIFISMQHVKYLVPYHPDTTPYSLKPEYFLVQPSQVTLSRTFEQQLKKLEGMFVVLDLGENPIKIGLLQASNYPVLELHTANGRAILHTEHVKTIHLPSVRREDPHTGRVDKK